MQREEQEQKQYIVSLKDISTSADAVPQSQDKREQLSLQVERMSREQEQSSRLHHERPGGKSSLQTAKEADDPVAQYYREMHDYIIQTKENAPEVKSCRYQDEQLRERVS